MSDQLFLLRPGYFKGEHGPYYCLESLAIEGLLSFYPELRNIVTVHYVDYPKLNPLNFGKNFAKLQAVPMLLLSEHIIPKDKALNLQQNNDARYLLDEADIRHYLATQYGVATAEN